MIRQSGSPYAKKARVKEGGGRSIHLLNAETGRQLRYMDVVLTERHTEPSGDTSFDEGKEEDQTEYDGVTSSDVGFLFVSLIMFAEKGGQGLLKEEHRTL